MFDMIAIDWGSKRCGLAFGSSTTELVIPYDQDCATSDSLKILNDQIAAKQIRKIILGRPTNFKGGETETSILIDQYADILKICFPQLDLVIWNERGTTQDAKDKLNRKDNGKKSGRINGRSSSTHRQKTNLNHLAAAQILEDYFKYSKV